MPRLSKNNILDSFQRYQLLKNNTIHGKVLSDKTLSGSKIDAGHYSQMVFSDFIFYGCTAKDVTFRNCVFENCSFIFSHIRNCHFENCSFFDCSWVASSSLHSVFSDCNLDSTMSSLLAFGENNLSLSESQKLTQEAHTQSCLAA